MTRGAPCQPKQELDIASCASMWKRNYLRSVDTCLQDAAGAPYALGREVGNADRLCEAKIGAVPEPLYKGIIKGAVGQYARPVLHVEARLLYPQPLQACPAAHNTPCHDAQVYTPDEANYSPDGLYEGSETAALVPICDSSQPSGKCFAWLFKSHH